MNTKLPISVILQVCLAVALFTAGARIVALFKPWRANEIYILSIALACIFTIGLVIYYRRRLTVVTVWRALGALVVGLCAMTWLLHSTHSSANRNRNLPNLQAHLDASKIPGLNGERQKTVDDHLFEQIVFDYFRGRAEKPRPAYELTACSDNRQVADDIVNGRFALVRQPPVDLGRDLSWDEEPIEGVSWNFTLHCFEFMYALLAAYESTGDQKYLIRADELVFDWIQDNSFYALRPPSNYSWYDHSTAARASAFIAFWETWIKSELATPAKAATLLGSLVRHAQVQDNIEIYKEARDDYAHGGFRDLTLLLVGTYFPELRDASHWKTLGTRRLLDQFAGIVSGEGVSRKHSPAYHLSSSLRFASLATLSDRIGIDAFQGDPFTTAVRKMAEVLPSFVDPDGRLAAIGDTDNDVAVTAKSSPVLQYYAAEVPALAFVLSKGASGTPPPKVVDLRKDGYVAIRNPFLRPGEMVDPVYFLFTAASNPETNHKHDDSLSFVLSCFGHPIVVDPGRYSYIDDDARRFFVGPAAHNTVVVDDEIKAISGNKSGDGDTRIHDVIANDDYIAILASRHRADGIVHLRSVLLLPPCRVEVVDMLKFSRAEDGSHTFDQYWQFAPERQMVLDGQDMTARSIASAGGPTITIRNKNGGASNGDASVFRGSKTPFLGWYSPSFGQMVPTTSLRFRRSGQTATFVTCLDVRSSGHQHLQDDACGDAVSTRVSPEELVFQWRTGERLLRVSLGKALDESDESMAR